MRTHYVPRKISVIGQGKLGCPISAVMATRGFQVMGVDADAQRVALINHYQPPVREPGLADLLVAAGGNYLATTDLEKAVGETDATFIIVPTPSLEDGSFSLAAVLAVCEGIGAVLARKRKYHLVVITSTVMPGSTDGPIRGCLEKASGKKCGSDFGLCYSPEFVALGSVIRDTLNPDMLLIGQCDDKAGQLLQAIGLEVARSKPAVARMNFVSAEIAKIAVNTYVTTKITFANMLASICQNLPGADVDVVTGALGLDSRIGRKYLTGAVGYGGPCFPRDNLALAALAQQSGGQADLALAVDAANRQGVQRLANLVNRHCPADARIAVLGLAYKPDTDVIEQSQGMMLAQELHRRGMKVLAYDPMAGSAARDVLPAEILVHSSLNLALAQADALVIVTPWDEFKNLAAWPGGNRETPRVIIDAWRCLDAQALLQTHPGMNYVAVGRGPEAGAANLEAPPQEEAAA